MSQDAIAAGVEFLMPVIVKSALPLKSRSREDYDDGVQAGTLLVIENLIVLGRFDPKKGNFVDCLTKTLAAVRMEARKHADAGTRCLHAILDDVDSDSVPSKSKTAWRKRDWGVGFRASYEKDPSRLGWRGLFERQGYCYASESVANGGTDGIRVGMSMSYRRQYFKPRSDLWIEATRDMPDDG